jgi:hypothetical protein
MMYYGTLKSGPNTTPWPRVCQVGMVPHRHQDGIADLSFQAQVVARAMQIFRTS